jgi:8-hydroxy-5-deazaflavin:NADPH oxidoreductase
MNIAIIGAGNLGGTLALAFRRAGHSVLFGVRNAEKEFKGREAAIANAIGWENIPVAVEKSDIVVISVPAQFAHEVARELGDLSNKVVIDTMNAVLQKPGGYSNTGDAILHNSNVKDLVKCFNSTGFENLADPDYGTIKLDMFMAGESVKAKGIATQLAKDIGFDTVYDFGGNDKFLLLEQFAFSWINLAILQKQGRDMAFKVIRRQTVV